MNKITKFDKNNVSQIADEINKALKAVADKYQIQIKTGGGKYDPDTATLKLELQTINESGIIVTKEATTFKQYATLLNLQSTDLFREFTFNKQKYMLVGYSARKSKFPMLCKNLTDNKNYGLPEEPVVKALNESR